LLKRFLSSVVLLSIVGYGCANLPGQRYEIVADLKFITDPLLEGRKVGTDGEKIAAVYIKSRFEGIGYEAEILDFSTQECWHSRKTRVNGKNVVARIDGSKNKTIILSAHFDGVGGDPFRPAADDNASGTTALMALARKMKNREWNHNFLLIAFGGEEAGLCGSIAYTQDISTRNLSYAINLDMVGRPLEPKRYSVYLTGDDDRAKELVSAFKRSSAGSKIKLVPASELKEEPWWRWRSDHRSFHKAGVLAVMLTDGNPFDGGAMNIHTPNDTEDKINYEYLESVVDLVYDALVELDRKQSKTP
jgi:Zn-dependent M28 family amino/carboxypeptidase